MSKRNAAEWYEELEIDSDDFTQIVHRPPSNQSDSRKTKIKSGQIVEMLAQPEDENESYNFTYHAKLHEKEWIGESLGDLYHQGWIDDVLRIVKGGKEATVYLCHSSAGVDTPLVAGKVYRPRKFRNLKKDHLYREGRDELEPGGQRIIDDRILKAIRKRTSFGKEVMHTSWLEHEFATLQLLYAVGVDVPHPYITGNNVILMDYIGDEDVPASPLAFIRLRRKEAQRLFERVVYNIELMLSQNRIHADLSAYNILYWEGEIRLIDFPQAIETEANPSAFLIFQRDVRRVCEYFTRQGVDTNPHKLAADLWSAYHHRLTPEANPAFLNADDESDVAYWKSQRTQ